MGITGSLGFSRGWKGCETIRWGTTIEAAIGPGKSIWHEVPGICKRYVNGQFTNDPLWPWPMNQRIKDALVQSGRAPWTSPQRWSSSSDHPQPVQQVPLITCESYVTRLCDSNRAQMVVKQSETLGRCLVPSDFAPNDLIGRCLLGHSYEAELCSKVVAEGQRSVSWVMDQITPLREGVDTPCNKIL